MSVMWLCLLYCRKSKKNYNFVPCFSEEAMFLNVLIQKRLTHIQLV